MLTQEQVKEYFDYNQETGSLIWRKVVRPAERRFIGNQAGCLLDGYRVLSFSITGRKKVYKAHRIIWLWMTGEMPDQIDHINGIRDDNRWSNLRNCAHFENMRNVAHVKGYHKVKNRDLWKVQIRPLDGAPQIFIGYRKTEEEARNLYLSACEKYHGKEWMTRKIGMEN